MASTLVWKLESTFYSLGIMLRADCRWHTCVLGRIAVKMHELRRMRSLCWQRIIRLLRLAFTITGLGRLALLSDVHQGNDALWLEHQDNAPQLFVLKTKIERSAGPRRTRAEMCSWSATNGHGFFCWFGFDYCFQQRCMKCLSMLRAGAQILFRGRYRYHWTW